MKKAVSLPKQHLLERIMGTQRLAIPAALLLSVVLGAPTSAEARFGKRSGSSGGSSHGSGSAGGGGGYHGASPSGGGVYYAPRSYYVPYRPYYGWPSFYYGWGFGYYPYFGYYPPYYYYPYAYPAPEQPFITQQAPRPTIKTTIGAEGQTYSSNGGGSVGVNLGFEGQRIGVNAQFTSIFAQGANSLDGYFGTDTIKLFNIYATYAVVANPRGRLRIEGGLTSAFAPDLIVAGPGVGFSGLVNIAGPLGAEGAIHATPFPYRQLDWNAGLALYIGPLAVRGGWRRIWLDDRGLVDGVINQDAFGGPYLGLGLAFF